MWYYALIVEKKILLSSSTFYPIMYIIITLGFWIKTLILQFQVSDKNLMSLIRRKVKLNQPYAGVFLKTDDE